jgi:hypothetical protein
MRRPRRVRQPQTPLEVVRLIRAIRERHPRWGEAKLAVMLRREGCAVSVSTVGRTFSLLAHHERGGDPNAPGGVWALWIPGAGDPDRRRLGV